MDGSQFDELVKRLGTTRATRLAALRGLAAGVFANLAGLSLFADEATAKKGRKNKGKGKKNRKKRTLCHCDSAAPSSCRTIKVTKEAKSKHLKRDGCDYSGPCTGVSGCPGAPGTPCQTRAQCSEGLICVSGQCANCSFNLHCGGPAGFVGEACVNGLCTNCTSNTQCEGGICVSGRCTSCSHYTQCAGGVCLPHVEGFICQGGEVCTINRGGCYFPLRCLSPAPDDDVGRCRLDTECAVNADCAMSPTTSICVLGLCTAECVPGGPPCPAGRDCRFGVCLPT
jgi:hypothetical protein